MPNKTKAIITTLLAGAMASATTGCGTQQTMPPKPTDKNCSDWKADRADGVWQCNDQSSAHYGGYYYGGRYYSNKSSLNANSSFKSYSSSYHSSGRSGGFGSAFKGAFGG